MPMATTPRASRGRVARSAGREFIGRPTFLDGAGAEEVLGLAE
ncbi:MAG: hypothetical protein ACRDQ5_16495 [Sciscionella sp.]